MKYFLCVLKQVISCFLFPLLIRYVVTIVLGCIREHCFEFLSPLSSLPSKCTLLILHLHVMIVCTISLSYHKVTFFFISRLTDLMKFNYSVSTLELGKGKIYRKFFHPPRTATWAGMAIALYQYLFMRG